MYDMKFADDSACLAVWCCADDSELTVQVADDVAGIDALFDAF